MDEQGDVITSLTQRGYFDRENIEAIKKVFPELSVSDHGGQIAMSSGNHPDIDLNRLRTSKPFELLLLDCSQQFGLQFQTDITDLVQEKRSVIRKFESSLLLYQCSRKCSLFVAKKFALEEPDGIAAQFILTNVRSRLELRL